MQETKYTIQNYYHVLCSGLLHSTIHGFSWISIANLQMLHVKIV